MNEIVIRDVPIKFPFKPYKVQEDYMSKVLECLQQGVNGILESPTGTGKTLSLLCSSLAWQQAKKAQVQVNAQATLQVNNTIKEAFNKKLQNDINKSAGVVESEDGSWGRSFSAPTIIYASRTHSQLTQAIGELKRSQYNFVTAAVLGSRDQLCIHPDLHEEQGYMKIAMCRAKTKSKSCHYYNNVESKKYALDDFLPKQVLDIEDLVKFGHKNQCCPYFTARNMVQSSDIIFTPYNYLLNPQTRRQQGINVSNAVIILDEAHNIEKVCEEAASVQISSTEIALCIAEVTEVMKKFGENENKEVEDSQTPPDFTMEDLCVLKSLFLQVETVIDEIKLDTEPGSGNQVGKKFPGSYIFEILQKAEILGCKAELVSNALVTLAQYLATVNDSALARKGANLEKFSEFLKVVFDSSSESQTNSDLYYRVYIEPELPKKAKRDAWFSNKTKVSAAAKIIHFWCFSPGFTMRSLVRQGVHSVILTSGTLSPLHATIAELDIPIPVQLENPHIIQPNQINVSIISNGPTNEQLTSAYRNRENLKYLSDLGRTLINFCRVIPGGVLVFFPSFMCMEKSKLYWMEQGLWSQLDAIKVVYTEPQRSMNLPDIIRNFNHSLDKENSNGAVFLAVMRGKVSEGMDFADSRCRAVFVTGLPYPPYKDPRVIMKQEYIDNMRKNKTGMTLTGRDWYELEATRAVNQAIGRVIRHAADFGAIIFLDCRFEYPKIINTLSAWLRPQITKFSEFGPAYGRVSRFFKEMGANPPKRPVMSGARFDYSEIKIRQKEATVEKPQKENKDTYLMGFLGKFKATQPTASPQPSPQGLFDALNTTSQVKTVDILRTVYNNPNGVEVSNLASTSEEAKESYIQPAPKRRKLKIVPLKFDSEDTDAPSTSQTNNIQERKKTTKEYLEEVRSRLIENNYSQWSAAVKTYNKDNNYDAIVLCLRKVFPDARTRDLFIGFKRFIKPEHQTKFEGLCTRLFRTS